MNNGFICQLCHATVFENKYLYLKNEIKVIKEVEHVEQ
jgi:hypothetical protein